MGSSLAWTWWPSGATGLITGLTSDGADATIVVMQKMTTCFIWQSFYIEIEKLIPNKINLQLKSFCFYFFEILWISRPLPVLIFYSLGCVLSITSDCLIHGNYFPDFLYSDEALRALQKFQLEKWKQCTIYRYYLLHSGTTGTVYIGNNLQNEPRSRLNFTTLPGLCSYLQ